MFSNIPVNQKVNKQYKETHRGIIQRKKGTDKANECILDV